MKIQTQKKIQEESIEGKREEKKKYRRNEKIMINVINSYNKKKGERRINEKSLYTYVE